MAVGLSRHYRFLVLLHNQIHPSARENLLSFILDIRPILLLVGRLAANADAEVRVRPGVRFAIPIHPIAFDRFRILPLVPLW